MLSTPEPGRNHSAAHIAVFTAPAHSHVNALLGIIEELTARGHRVSWATTPEFASAVEAAGATAVIHDPGLPQDPAAWPTDVHRLPLLYLAAARTALPHLLAGFAADRPDLVLTEDPAGAGRLLAATWGIPAVQVWSYAASPDHWSLRPPAAPGANPAAGEFLAQLTGLLAAQGVGDTAEQHLTGALDGGIVLLPRAFQPGGDGFGPQFHFVGPALGKRPAQGTWAPPPSGRPVLLVSLGSIDNAHPEFYRLCFDAFADLPWHVVLPIGSRVDPATLGRVPANFEVREQVPQLVVLAHASAFVHHGGMGSTMEGLHHGVPTLALPRLPEQAVNARQLVALGLGRALPPRTLTAERLRAAVLDVAENRAISERVRAMQKAILDAGGACAAADVIEDRLRRPRRTRPV
ncbi:macrolide family glycosyltransferase [Streptomyces sp. NPDC090021]|uniref:macrolide family glycosyltransferase n=1 Tax=Streptomyces sp. NPDC090021 TaxID=3365919 RepID=UPI00382331FE